MPGFFGIVRLNHIGPLSSLAFLCAIAYAILKHSFLDIRVAIQRSLLYALSFFALAMTYIAAMLALDYFFEYEEGILAPVCAGITVLIGIYGLPRLEIRFREMTDPVFFKDALRLSCRARGAFKHSQVEP